MGKRDLTPYQLWILATGRRLAGCEVTFARDVRRGRRVFKQGSKALMLLPHRVKDRPDGDVLLVALVSSRVTCSWGPAQYEDFGKDVLLREAPAGRGKMSRGTRRRC